MDGWMDEEGWARGGDGEPENIRGRKMTKEGRV